jgi:mRNA interferase RelE/StbE
VNSSYKVELRRPAAKFLAKQDRATQRRIIQALEGLQKVPPEGDIKPMKGHPGLYRLRIGTYRAVYEVDHSKQIVYVRVIGNRGDVYKG